MKNLLLTITLLVAGAVGVSAQTQTVDNTEVYGGYQFTRTNVETRIAPSFKFNSETDSNGLNLSATQYVSKNVGLTAEVAGTFNSDGKNLYTAMGGVTLKANRSGKYQPFVRGLAGSYLAQNAKITGTERNTSGFSYAVGGGFDVKFKNVTWRVVQADYLATRNFGQFDNNVRVGTGFVF